MMVSSDVVYARLSKRALGFAFGVMKGFSLMLLALLAMKYNMGVNLVHDIGHFYYGYGASVQGSLLGLCWGFVEGFVCGVIMGFLYNWCVCCCCKKKII